MNFPGHWADKGCDVASRCLECPLPRCRYEVTGGLRALRNAKRNPEIVRRYRAGERADEIAVALGVSRRTVCRVVAGRRAA